MVEWNVSELSVFCFVFLKATVLGIMKPMSRRETRVWLLIDCEAEKQILSNYTW